MAMGSNDDPAARRAAAAALRSIATRASNQFSDGGSNDIWCRRVLPMAYIGQREKDIGPLWKEVWDEGISATTSSLGVDGVSCNLNPQEKLLPWLAEGITDALEDVSWNRRLTACQALTELAGTVLAPLVPPPVGNDGSQVRRDFVLRMKRRAKASGDILFTCTMLIVKSRLWDGKADLVKVTSKIAGNWASPPIHTVLDHASAKDGMEDGFGDIPVVRRLNVWSDLYLNDGWFIGDRVDGPDDENGSTEYAPKELSDDEENKTEDKMLDFDQADDMLRNVDAEDETMNAPPSQPADTKPSKKPPSSPLIVSGLCRVLLEEAISCNGKPHLVFYDSDALPYRASVLQGLVDLLKSTQQRNDKNKITVVGEETNFSEFLYGKLAPSLISVIQGRECTLLPSLVDSEEETNEKPVPPLIIARSIACLSAAMWNRMHKTSTDPSSDVGLLVKLFALNCGAGQAAWTVREASALAAATLAQKARSSCLRKLECIESLLDCTAFCLRDKKFWRVRHAGLELLSCLCRRTGGTSSNDRLRAVPRTAPNVDEEERLVLEALLPYKEKILQICRSSSRDSESRVTAVATDICNHMAWWP